MTETARLAEEQSATEETITGARRQSLTLGGAFREFLRHPSPWMMATVLAGAVTWRIAEGDWQTSDLWGPVLFVALFPVMEWTIHVFILHWKPRQVGPVKIDTQLASAHRRHHRDPRDLPLVFIPWQTLIFVILGLVGIPLLAFPRIGAALSFVILVSVVGLVYEWMHYLMHTDYRPKSRAFRKVWRNHRLHHFKSEKYWFTVTTAGTADRLFGTCPDPATVPTSPTAKNLHALDA
ncbi:MAG TPA: sterol desaturase family protein [Aeromicrobium sp.]|nr:sterol desaturase family protein [Aeromicrobium sp.]HKY58017.1 sterol desaturase family protein [Aeromicrobium sp.]